MGAHTLVIGVTESGKSTYCKFLCEALTRKGNHTCVLNPFGETDWHCDAQSPDPDTVMAYCHSLGKRSVFLDEAGDSLAREPRFDWFTSGSRHKGNSVYVISQRCNDLTPRLRNNCTELVVFSCEADDAGFLAKKYRDKRIVAAAKFRPGQFFIVSQFRPLLVGELNWQKRQITAKVA